MTIYGIKLFLLTEIVEKGPYDDNYDISLSAEYRCMLVFFYVLYNMVFVYKSLTIFEKL